MQMAIDDAWIAARQRTVRVLLTAAMEDAPCTADRSLLTRALTNVLSNALKYSPPGADLHCSVTEAETESGPTWRIGVQDQGPGIPPELQSQLFQPFHRLHRDSHPDVHGIGLGLLLVRTAVIAALHRGLLLSDELQHKPWSRFTRVTRTPHRGPHAAQ